MKKLLTLIAAVLTVTAVEAQWNTTGKPVAVYDLSDKGEYDVFNPIAARTTDGKTWLSYLIWEDGGVHTYVQLLDKNGVKQFDGMGLRVNNYETPQWWSKYELAVAADGSALVSVADSRSEKQTDADGNHQAFQPAFYKISQQGDFLWGPDGVTFPDYQMAPNTEIVVNGDDVFVQFTDVSDLQRGTYMNRISAVGTLAFEKCKPLKGQLIPSAGSDMLVFASGDDGATVNRVDRDLNPVWTQPVVYDTYAYAGYEMRPYKIAPDGRGGAAVAFTRNMGDYAHNIRLQYISADGETGFGPTGIDTYDAEENDHDYPNIAFNPHTQKILVDWEDKIGEDPTVPAGTYTQSVGQYSCTGTRDWGGKGIQILSKDSPTGNGYGRIGSGYLDNGDWILAVRDAENWGDEQLVVMRLSPEGTVVWKKTLASHLDVKDPTMIVEQDATYIFYRNASSLDMVRIFNADGSATGISNVSAPTAGNATAESYYSIDGMRTDGLHKGFNIVCMTDGSVHKVIKK